MSSLSNLQNNINWFGFEVEFSILSGVTYDFCYEKKYLLLVGSYCFCKYQAMHNAMVALMLFMRDAHWEWSFFSGARR